MKGKGEIDINLNLQSNLKAKPGKVKKRKNGKFKLSNSSSINQVVFFPPIFTFVLKKGKLLKV